MDIFVSIARNGALLLSLIFLYSLFIPYIQRVPRWINSIVTGLLFGGFAVLNMLEPLRLGNGVVIDARNTILLLAAALGGVRAGFGALLIAGLYRFSLGGDGVWVGLASMFCSTMLGILYQRYQKKLVFDRKIILLGLLLALESLLWTLALPNGDGWKILPSIILPVLIIFPGVTYIMAWLIASVYQRIELSHALRESEGRFRAVFEQSLQFLCLMDADGTIRSLSPSLVRGSALSHEQILNKKFWDVEWKFMPNEQREALKHAILAANQQKISQLNLDLSTPERQTLINVSFQKIAETEQILMEAHDITEQVMGEKRRLELQFERERNGILQQLIGDASHHLRTPLAIITSSLYLLRKQTEKHESSPEWQQKMENQFKKLDSARLDLVEIVEDLLSMMQLDSPAAFRFERQSLVPYLSEILETYHAIADEKQITLRCEMPDKPVFASIAPTTFRRVIANLLENGLRYTPSGGSVSLCLKQTGIMAEITVQDTGIGIPEEDLPRIFDRFFRAKNASSQSLKGTGLGLAIVKKTVDMHGGQIEVKSEMGQGTRMAILIPMLNSSVLAAS